MPTPTASPERNLSRLIAERPYLYGALTLVLLSAISFILVFSYMSDKASADAQMAAAAAANAPSAFDDVTVEAESAIVVDLTTGKVLYEKNADAQLALASLTKVALILAVSEALDFDSSVHIPEGLDRLDSVHLLPEGEVWSVKDLAAFTLVTSSNQGAEVLAEEAAPFFSARYPSLAGTSATIERMNDIAREAGLTSTYFLNPHGLDLSETQSGAYGSARDMARLFAHAASRPELFAATTRGDVTLASLSGGTTAAPNTNEALPEIPGLIMGKTGFTDIAGGNLAIVFDVGLSHPVAAVVLGSSRDGRFSDMATLVETTRREITRE